MRAVTFRSVASFAAFAHARGLTLTAADVEQRIQRGVRPIYAVRVGDGHIELDASEIAALGLARLLGVASCTPQRKVLSRKSRPFTAAEQARIVELRAAGMSHTAIGREVGASESTISRFFAARGEHGRIKRAEAGP